MSEENLKLLLAFAGLIILYLLTRKPAKCAVPVTPASVAETNLTTSKLKNALGIKGSLRRMLKNEDPTREHILIGINEICPGGYSKAPDDFTISNGGCHVTCGGGSMCGDTNGNDTNGLPVPQKCCLKD